jgi:hypothetical protein
MKEVPDLAISTEKVAAILAKARQFDVKDVVTDPDSGSNASDEAMLSVQRPWSDLSAGSRASSFRSLRLQKQVIGRDHIRSSCDPTRL